MHPSERLKGLSSKLLEGRHIVVGVSGSIAAVESVKLVHELRRHSADVTVVMSHAAQAIITPQALHYASGRAVVTELTGEAEHVALCDGRPGSADLLLLAPATANTLAKAALGIDDTAVTSCAAVALGSGVPVVAAPAMHDVMNENPAIQARLKDLQALGVTIVPPRMEEEKAKMAEPEAVVDHVIRALAPPDWKGKRALVISGATAEPVDPIRVLTNRSSGRMGIELAKALFRRGADVELWNAWGNVPLPSWIAHRRFEQVSELIAMIKKASLAKTAAVFMPAALGDFAPVEAKAKLSSSAKDLKLTLKPLPKVILEARKAAPKAQLVAFKAESEAKQLEARAKARLAEYKADWIVANAMEGFGGPRTKVLVLRSKGAARTLAGSKTDVALAIVDEVASAWSDKGSS
jgi:phosphopantothenoylcysteine decarboxylase / phosphopantothenate---cysteine ligase